MSNNGYTCYQMIPEDELVRFSIRRIKALAKHRVPDYDQPADSFIEMAVRDVIEKSRQGMVKEQ